MEKWSKRIAKWAEDRNLIEGSNPGAQMSKLLEEVGELASALHTDDTEAMVDAIGDISVVLAVIAAQLGLDFEDCLEAAWGEIRDRRGVMVNGVFVKAVGA